jgi:hypothetical protein
MENVNTAARMYRGVQIVPSIMYDNVTAGRRWQIVNIHPDTHLAYSEEHGRGYYTLAQAREAIRLNSDGR